MTKRIETEDGDYFEMTPEERARKVAQLAELSSQFAGQSQRDQEITAMFVTLAQKTGFPIPAESIAAAVTSASLEEDRVVKPGGLGNVTFPGARENLPVERDAMAQGGRGGDRRMVHQTSGKVPQGAWQVVRLDSKGKTQ